MSTDTITIEVDRNQLFDMVASAGDGGAHVGQRLAGVLLGDTSVITHIALGVYGVVIVPSDPMTRLASTDSPAQQTDEGIVA